MHTPTWRRGEGEGNRELRGAYSHLDRHDREKSCYGGLQMRFPWTGEATGREGGPRVRSVCERKRLQMHRGGE